jgi:hypothetical protein
MEKQISVTFFSNYLIHHQTPFCEAMVKIIVVQNLVVQILAEQILAV